MNSNIEQLKQFSAAMVENMTKYGESHISLVVHHPSVDGGIPAVVDTTDTISDNNCTIGEAIVLNTLTKMVGDMAENSGKSKQLYLAITDAIANAVTNRYSGTLNECSFDATTDGNDRINAILTEVMGDQQILTAAIMAAVAIGIVEAS